MALGTGLISPVANPFYGVITNPNSVLSKATVQRGYLLAPYPPTLYVNNIPIRSLDLSLRDRTIAAAV